MTVSRITILAFGLTFLTWTALTGTAAKADGGACGPEATCAASCEAGCSQAGGQASGNCGNFAGFQPTDFCHDPGCQYADNPGGLERDPIFSEFKPQWDDLCERCGSCTWRVDASAVALIRSNPTTNITLLTNVNTGDSLVDGSAFQYSYHVGPRLSFVVTDCEGLGLELTYMGIDGWSSAHDYNNAALPGGFTDLVVDSVITAPLINAHVDIASMLHSSEINVRKTLVNNLDFLAGFRWIDMFDRYDASGTSAVTGNALRESVETRNHLFGGQVGLDGSVGPASGNWRFGGFLKGGCALNSGDATTRLSDPGNFGDLSATDIETHFSFFGEAGLTYYYQVDKHVAVSAGYQVMYISGVAQPLNQISQTDLIGGSTMLNFGTEVFYHGANLGMEVSW